MNSCVGATAGRVPESAGLCRSTPTLISHSQLPTMKAAFLSLLALVSVALAVPQYNPQSVFDVSNQDIQISRIFARASTPSPTRPRIESSNGSRTDVTSSTTTV